MDVEESLRRIGETMHVRQVFGEPVVHEGTLVVPVASVWGLGGAGGAAGRRGDRDGDLPSEDATGRQTGGQAGGGGLLNRTRALGVYTVGPDGRTRWHPAVDVGRIALVAPIVLGSQAVAVVAVLAMRSLVRRRPRLSGR